MAKLQQIIDEEIRKHARREINRQVKKLREKLAALRNELAESKQRIKLLESHLNLPAAAGAVRKAEGEGIKVRVTPGRIRKWRGKIGCSQAQYAALLGVNMLSVCHWESGKTTPRAEQKRKIAALRDMSKHDLVRLMAEKSVVPVKKKKTAVKAAKPAKTVKAAKTDKTPKAAKAAKKPQTVKQVKTVMPAKTVKAAKPDKASKAAPAAKAK